MPSHRSDPAQAPWLRRQGRGDGRTLVCFHHAGAGASTFARWPATAGLDAAWVFVQLKGREERCADVLDEPIDALASDIAGRLQRSESGELVLIGHSMGGTLAWWVAAALWRAHGRRSTVVLSAQAPARPAGLARIQGHAEGADLRAWYAALGEPCPPALDHPELAALAGATLAQDLRWMRRALQAPAPGPLPVDLHAVHWTEDRLVTADDMRPWEALCSGTFARHPLPGGHLTLATHPASFHALLRQILVQESLHDRPSPAGATP